MSKSSPTVSAGTRPPAADPALLGRHEAALRTYLTGLQGTSATQVESVIREIMREAPGQPEFEDDPAVWLFAQGHRRIAGSGQRVTDAAESARDEEAAAGEDPAIAVHQAFGRLTNKQQEILRLKFQFGFNLEELARITAVSQSGAGGLLHAAVERLCRATGSTLSLGEGRGGDIRLTAYALDEMESAEKRAFAESVPDTKALLESSEVIRKVAAQLARVLESGAPMPKRRRRRKGSASWKSSGVWLGAIAVMVAGALAWYFLRDRGPGKVSRAAAEGSFAGGDTVVHTRSRADESADAGRSSGGSALPGFSSGSDRRARPGEAAWERKPFGQGHGTADGATGSGAEGSADPVDNSAAAGGEAGPVGSNSGARSAGSASGASSRNDPAAENRGEREASEAGKDRAASSNEAPDDTKLLPDAPVPDQGAPTVAAAQPKPVSAGGAMKPAQPDVKEAAKKPPATPKEASKIPAKQPQLAPFTPTLRQLAKGKWPKPAEVKVAELIQRGPLERTPELAASAPLMARMEITQSPWQPEKQIVRATVKARPTRPPSRPPVNLVFAIDVSQSMAGPNRLPLVQEGIRLLAERLRPEDRVAVVTYAAQAKEMLPGNPLGEKALELRNCLTGLEASGQTNGYEGLQLAYDTARKNRVTSGLNVVVLCTDGNFNLGETDENVLAALAAQTAAEGIKLSVFGFGRSDRNDLRLELLATQGGGHSCYVNTREEAERLLSGQIDGLVETVATEVTLDVKFDSSRVGEVRRIDGGNAGTPVRELLSGRSLNALYEVSLAPGAQNGARLATLEVNYRATGTTTPARMEKDFESATWEWTQLDAGFRFAIAWSEFGRILREGGPAAATDLDRVESWVTRFLPDDSGGYRLELLDNIVAARAVASGLER